MTVPTGEKHWYMKKKKKTQHWYMERDKYK